MASVALKNYVHSILCHEDRTSAETARRAWLPDVVHTALTEGCCVLCALRMVAVSRPLLYAVPRAALSTAVAAVLHDAGLEPRPISSADGAPRDDQTCVACLGVLQGPALFKRPPPGATELSNLSAAQCVVRWGTMSPPSNVVPPAAPPVHVANWLDAVTTTVAHSGFDLSGGIAVSLSGEA